MDVQTPFTGKYPVGTRLQISVPLKIVQLSKTYHFKKWENNSTEPTRTVVVTADLELSASYKRGKP